MRICSRWPVKWVTWPEASWPAGEESGAGYLDNALIKARAAAIALDLPALADDSGIEVDVLEGGPGPRSARFAGDESTDEENLRLLMERVAPFPTHMRTARYRCVAACVWPGGQEAWAEGVCEGSIVPEPRGSGGFGYDPVFVPEGESRTMAELSPEEKDAISHRGRAFRALRAPLSEGIRTS